MNVEYVASQYLDLMDKSYEERYKFPSMSYISVSTMTIIAQLTSNIDVSLLNRRFVSPAYPLCTIKKAKEHHEYELTARGKKKKSFYNQTTIEFTDHTKKSIKVFYNGKLQLTGITSVVEALSVIDIVCSVVNNIQDCAKDQNAQFQNLSIAMINTNFSYNCGIDILALQSLLKNCSNMHSTFDPDRYPGLNIKHKSADGTKTSILFFSTGNVVITGVNSFAAICNAFAEITNIVYENIDILKTNVLHHKPKKASNVYSMKDGYTKRELRSVGVVC